MTKHTKLIHAGRDFYRCEITGWIYQFIGCIYAGIYKFTLVKGDAANHTINKYKEDVVKKNMI